MCIDSNPWLLEPWVAELLSRLTDEVPDVLREGILDLRAGLEKDSGRDPEVAAARERSRIASDELGKTAHELVGKHQGAVLEDLFHALDQVPLDGYADRWDNLYLALNSLQGFLLEEVAQLWLIWRVHERHCGELARKVAIARETALALRPWIREPAVAARRLALLNLTLEHAELLGLDSVRLIHIQLELAYTHSALFAANFEERHLKPWLNHSTSGFRLCLAYREYDFLSELVGMLARAMFMLPGESQGGRAGATKFLRGFLATETDVPDDVRASAEHHLAACLMGISLDASNAADLEEAHGLLLHAAETLERTPQSSFELHEIYCLLGALEMQRSGEDEPDAINQAIAFFEKGLALWSPERLLINVGTPLVGYADALLRSGRSPRLALDWIERALHAPEAPLMGILQLAQLKVKRAELLRLCAAQGDQREGWYDQALEDLAVRRTLGRALVPPDWLLEALICELAVHQQAGLIDEAISAYSRGVNELAQELSVEAESAMHLAGLRLLIERGEGRDRDQARRVLQRILSLASEEKTRAIADEAVVEFLEYAATEKRLIELRDLEATVSAFLSDRQTPEAGDARLLLVAWRSRSQPPPLPEQAFVALLQWARDAEVLADKSSQLQVDRMKRRSSEALHRWGVVLHFAARAIGLRRRETLEAALEYERHLLEVPEKAVNFGLVSALSDVALVRLQSEPPSLRQAQAARKLLDTAQRWAQRCGPLPEAVRVALTNNTAVARTLVVGLNPSLGLEAVLAEAREIVESLAALPNENQTNRLESLCQWLWQYQSSDRPQLEAFTRELQHRMGGEGIRFRLPDEMDERWSQRKTVQNGPEDPMPLALNGAGRLFQEALKELHFAHHRPLERYPPRLDHPLPGTQRFQ